MSKYTIGQKKDHDILTTLSKVTMESKRISVVFCVTCHTHLLDALISAVVALGFSPTHRTNDVWSMIDAL